MCQINLLKLEIFQLVVCRPVQSPDLAEKRWADIVGNDVSSDVLVAPRRHVLEGKPRPVDEFVLFKLVLEVLESEVGLDGAIIGQDQVLASASLDPRNRLLEE